MRITFQRKVATKRPRSLRVLLIIALATFALSHASDARQAQPVSEQLRLADVMPRGAMLYLQARDLKSLMSTWLASPIRDGFYKSRSFAAFSESRIYLKLQDRRKDFEKAIGFGLDESRLAELAGGASAVAVYDIGNIDIVFVTEVARERAVATALFRQLAQFEERSSAAGVYYAREVSTDGGSLTQQFCFAYASGKLIVTTTEGLMLRALANANAAGADSLMADVTATAERAQGFSTHDLTMWLDQARLNRNRHFNAYWIHHNVRGADAASLAAIETGLIDLQITRSGLVEQRWFVIAGPAAARASLNSDQAKALIRFAPAAAQLVQARAQRENSEDAARAVSHALFGVLPAGASEPNDIPPDRTRATDEDGGTGGRTERYSHLDARFDRDVDDEQAPGEKRGGPQFSDSKPGSSNLKAEPAGADRDGSAFAKRLGQILKPASPDAYCELARSKVETGKPFVGFERAVVIETEPEKLDRAAIEGAIIEEMRSRFVVGGVDPGLNWQDEGDVRFLAQTLLEQGAAVGVAGKYIVVASSKEFARDILQAGSAAASTTATIEGDVEFYAVIRVAAAKSIFDRLMSTLDMKPQAQEEDQTHEVRFFSENLSSLVSAAGFREVRVRRASEGALMVETVLYSW